MRREEREGRQTGCDEFNRVPKMNTQNISPYPVVEKIPHILNVRRSTITVTREKGAT
jgi:hypothetical protein